MRFKLKTERQSAISGLKSAQHRVGARILVSPWNGPVADRKLQLFLRYHSTGKNGRFDDGIIAMVDFLSGSSIHGNRITPLEGLR